MLEVVLERVISSDSGIQEIKGDLLDLTQTMKEHEVSIKHLEERMNLLTSQMEAGASMKTKELVKKYASPIQNRIDEEDMEWDVEETFFKETLEAVLLNIDSKGREGLEEVVIRKAQLTSRKLGKNAVTCTGNCVLQALGKLLDWFLLWNGDAVANHGLPLSKCRIISTSRQQGKGKDLMTNATSQEAEADEAKRIDQIHFGLNKRKTYYDHLKKRWSITTEARFEVDSFKDDFPNTYDRFQIRDWKPFMMPLDPYFLELGMIGYLKEQIPSGYDSMLTLHAITGPRSSHHPRGNQLYLLVDPVRPSLEFKRKLVDKDNQFEWMADIIAVVQPQWEVSKGIIQRHDLKFEVG
ncbi:hypothetical protein HAX54_029323, partial [Datura stramonium]|nr:hypothetical protein [Datura stramonium]